MFLTARRVSKKRWIRRAFWGLVLVTLGYLIYSGFRGRKLLENGREIERQSASFTRDYELGVGAPTLKYLVMGDSTAAGWGAGKMSLSYPYRVAQSLAQRGFRVHVENIAIGGATMGDVREHQLSAIGRVRPDLISLSAGANDATHFRTPDDFARDWKSVRAALEASTARCVLVANVPDLSYAPALPLLLGRAAHRRGQAFNLILRGSLSGRKLRLIDLYGQGKLDYGREPQLYAADLFHPSGLGYERWAAIFAGQLEGI